MSLTDSHAEPAIIASIGDLVGLWPSLADFATDLDIPYDTAKGMRRRGKIDSSYWVSVVASASRRNIAGVSYELLAQLHAR